MSKKAIQTVGPKEKTQQQAFENIQRESVKVFLHVQSKWGRFWKASTSWIDKATCCRAYDTKYSDSEGEEENATIPSIW
ncbi:hypothetical protein G6F37_006897 [Rhizopus arrhizus]|nr:hypothetical protein G6F38_008913 [Rhizopus arrhizus]KAG1157217.1 hypothetical protein G6F37_006897 [Rhizopus arrhizus]